MANLSWTVGAVRITRVEESVDPIAVDVLFPEVTQEQLEPYREQLQPSFMDEDGKLILAYHSLVVEVDGLTLLVDTCFGEHDVPEWREVFPPGEPGDIYFSRLAEAGYTPEDIDIVLCTHMHFDHVGWNTRYEDGELVPTFPNATYLFGREEWEYWSTREREVPAGTIEVTVRPLVEGGQAQLVETDHRVSESVWLEPSPGHSPGHIVVRITTNEGEILLSGDAVHSPVQWSEPTWCALADPDQASSHRSRLRLIDEHANQGTLILGAHIPAPCAGRLVTTDHGVRFVAER